MKTNQLLGKTILISGATGGIGKVAALRLADMGASVAVVGRSAQRVDETVAAIRQSTGNDTVEGWAADLSIQSEIHRLADAFSQKHDRLDVLLNNAGGVFTSRQESTDGIEMTFALDHLNYFLLTNLMLGLLKAADRARVVSVSSMAHAGGHINFDDLEAKRSFSSWGAYSQAKLANVLFTYELARRVEGTNITANTLHPGFVATNFGRSNGGFAAWVFRLSQIAAISPEEGAQTSIYLASSPEVERVTGKYFDKKQPKTSSRESYDQTVAAKLWEISQQMTGLS